VRTRLAQRDRPPGRVLQEKRLQRALNESPATLGTTLSTDLVPGVLHVAAMSFGGLLSQLAHRDQSEVQGVRKIVVYELLSLDGVAERPDSFFADWDDAMGANLAAVIATQDAVILGRRSYNEWAQFWPDSQIQPFATFINGVAKYVVTSTPLDRDWANATVLDGGLVEFVRDLRQQPGGDVGVHASISVAQALLAAGVVDEVRLVIAPRIVGRGRRLLDGLPSIQLESIRSGVSPTGYLLVDYRVLR
jgi:dihydrofolate reductase